MRARRVLSTLGNTFWILALAAIALFAFFVALGAFAPGDVAELSIGVGVLTLLWVGHATWEARTGEGRRDPATVRARERRGF